MFILLAKNGDKVVLGNKTFTVVKLPDKLGPGVQELMDEIAWSPINWWMNQLAIARFEAEGGPCL